MPTRASTNNCASHSASNSTSIFAKSAKSAKSAEKSSSNTGRRGRVFLARSITASCIALSVTACAVGQKQNLRPVIDNASQVLSPEQALKQQLLIEPLTQTENQKNVSLWPSVKSVDDSTVDTTTETEDHIVVTDSYEYASKQLQNDLDTGTTVAPADRPAASSGYLPPSLAGSNTTVDTLVSSQDLGFAAITYHRVDHDNSPYTVSPESFAAHMLYLYDNNYHTLSLTQLNDYLSGRINLPPRSVLITVDDGHRSSYSQIHPVLQRYGFHALYFPYSDFINNGGLTRQNIRTMLSDGGAEFGVHTKTHAALTLQHVTESNTAYEQRVRAEVEGPELLLKKLANPAIMSIAYPYGKVNRQVERLSKTAGMQFGFTVNCAVNTRTTNPMRLNRCTIGAQDDLDLFATKLTNPRLALRTIASRENQTADKKVRRSSSLSRIRAPEFLGNLADREFFTGIPIQPFSPYFIDPDGEALVYSASGLPAGLSIDRDSGTISGVPLAATIISGLTISATNQSGTTARTNKFDLVVH